MNFNDPAYLETVYAALFTQLQSAIFPSGLQLQSSYRVTDTPDNVPVAQQPALYQVQGDMLVEETEHFGVAKWTATAVVVVYFRADGAVPNNRDVLPDTVANYFVWGLMNALQGMPPGSKQTLGDLVYHCWIDGMIVPTVADQQCIVTVPIKILLGP